MVCWYVENVNVEYDKYQVDDTCFLFPFLVISDNIYQLGGIRYFDNDLFRYQLDDIRINGNKTTRYQLDDTYCILVNEFEISTRWYGM